MTPSCRGAMTYLFIFFAGLAGSLHCVGMCGMFPWSLAAHAPNHAWARQLAYNVGRVNTLVCIGALSGAFGAAIVTATPVRHIEQGLALVTGAFMIIVALEMLGVMRSITGTFTSAMQHALLGALRGTMQSGSWAAPVALGVFNAFLPCHLIYAFAALAAATASITGGALSMLAFGLGTIPALFVVGIARTSFPRVRWSHYANASALLVLAFGLLTLGRALGWIPHPSGIHSLH